MRHRRETRAPSSNLFLSGTHKCSKLVCIYPSQVVISFTGSHLIYFCDTLFSSVALARSDCLSLLACFLSFLTLTHTFKTKTISIVTFFFYTCPKYVVTQNPFCLGHGPLSLVSHEGRDSFAPHVHLPPKCLGQFSMLTKALMVGI